MLSFNSIKKFTVSQDWNITSDVMKYHERSNSGWSGIEIAVKKYYGIDTNIPFDKYVYVS